MSSLNHRRMLQLLTDGLFAVDKLKGHTSAQVLDNVKQVIFNEVPPSYHDITQSLKFGHGGTLDQTATGVLVIGCGNGCKSLSQLLRGDKRYLVSGCLGTATDTFNETGLVTERAPYDHVTLEIMNQTLGQFEGDVLQSPPKYSALKLGGKRLADLTRAGIQVEVSPRRVICHSVQCLEFSPPGFKLSVSCGGGFYVRSLVSDLGKALKTYAHVTQLRRTHHGPFTEQDSLEAQDWTLANILAAIRRSRDKYNSVLRRTRRKRAEVWDDR